MAGWLVLLLLSIPSSHSMLIRRLPPTVSSLFHLRARSRLPFTRRHNQSSSSPSKKQQPHHQLFSQRLSGLDQPTVWHEFSPLAVQHQSINLGQGFPDWDPPAFVLESMHAAVDVVGPGAANANQYARSAAHLPLANVLAELYTERWGTPVDPATQIATAVGCTQALYCALQGLVNPGDEVILLEPAFDIYDAQVKMAGGVPVHVPLVRQTQQEDGGGGGCCHATTTTTTRHANQEFSLDWDALQAAIDRRPKLLILNSPHNPTGKMFSRAELERIADMLHPDMTVIADEVYEHIVFDDNVHVSMATVCPEQTLTLSSAGKTFSATGWKVGWAVGPPRLVQAVAAVQQWVNFSAPTPNQEAIARSLRWARENTFTDPVTGTTFPTYYQYLAAEYQRKRGLLVDAIRAAGMTPILPAGGFFVMADTSAVDFPYREKYRDTVTAAMPTAPMPRDWALARWLTETVGVTAIPPSSFYNPQNRHREAANLLRFAFCKTDDTLLEAHRRFERYFGGNGNST